MIYLVVGFVFLILGFASLLQVRTIMKRDGTTTDKLERLMMRIGMRLFFFFKAEPKTGYFAGTFSILYMLPASAVLGCFLYEYLNLPDWLAVWQEKICRDKTMAKEWQVPCRYPDDQIPQVAPPNFHVFMLKYGMVLAIGIFSGFWVWSGKTLTTWMRFYTKLCGRNRREAHV